MPDIEALVKAKLGADTRFSSRVNGTAGFWISFKIDDDEYWLMLERERLEGLTGVQWLGWASVVGFLLLLGAAFISSLVNLPLARLTEAAREIAQGKRPAPLPEKGSKEIIEANRSFNQMVDDLQRVESDRAATLEGLDRGLLGLAPWNLRPCELLFRARHRQTALPLLDCSHGLAALSREWTCLLQRGQETKSLCQPLRWSMTTATSSPRFPLRSRPRATAS